MLKEKEKHLDKMAGLLLSNLSFIRSFSLDLLQLALDMYRTTQR